MRASILLTGAIAAGVIAQPLEARTFDICKKDSCFEKLLEHLHIHPDFCPKLLVGAVTNELTAFAEVDVKSACSCVEKSTSTGAVSSAVPTSAWAKTTDEVKTTGKPETTAEAKTTVEPKTSPRKCKSPKPTSSYAVPTSDIPTAVPTSLPVSIPVSLPTSEIPTAIPTSLPVSIPVSVPYSEIPTSLPISLPISEIPTSLPISLPISEIPTAVPTSLPISLPISEIPTSLPVSLPISEIPTAVPTSLPVSLPISEIPTYVPTSLPVSLPISEIPTAVPTSLPVSLPVSEIPTAVPTSLPVSLPVSEIPTAVPTSLPASLPLSAPTTLPTVSCPAPKIPGGDFSVLGELAGNAGMQIESIVGDCAAKVFGKSDVEQVGKDAIATLESHLGARNLLSAPLGVSGVLGNLFAGQNFLQITGQHGTSTQSACQKAPLCKGSKYQASILGALDFGPDAVMQFALGGNFLTSPTSILHGGVLSAGFHWEFTWQGETQEVDICVLTTLNKDLQSIGLAKFDLLAIA